MARDYLGDMILLQNEYRATLSRARTVNRFNNGEFSKEEGQLYMKAAEICGKMANMSTGATAEHWVEKQQECDARVREIAYAIDPVAAKTIDSKEEKSEKQPKAAKEEKEASSPDADTLMKGDEDISAETIKSWFDYPLDHGLDDVSGMEEIKKLLSDCAAAAGMNRLNTRMRLSKIRSYFFYGLPGCGKTFIIEAFAHELKKQGYTFLSLTGGQIHSQWQGIAEKTIEKAFLIAEQKAPSIIFIDEVESVCRNRHESNQAAHVQQTTTAFLNAYNRMKKSDKQIIFIGATNYPNLVDAAMMDRVVPVEITLPDAEALAHKLEHDISCCIELDDDITYEAMAKECVGFSYRDVEHLLDVLKDNIIRDVRAIYSNNDDMAADALEHGDYRLNMDMFMSAKNDPAAQPSEKASVLEELHRWRGELNNNR